MGVIWEETMGKMERHEITITVTCLIEVERSVIDGADTDDWRRQFGAMSRNEIVAYIARNMVLRGEDLSDVDGFADRKDEEARVFYVEEDVQVDPWQVGSRGRA